MPTSLIGRDRELERLRGYLDDAVLGAGRLVLLSGEPGIGKTRLSRELTELAANQGFLVSWGRSQEALGAPPLWPWIDALRSLVADREQAPADAARRETNRQLARLFSEVPEPEGAVSGTGRDTLHALFETLRRVLADAAVQQPRLIVLEDLHWSDPESLLLLEYLASHLGTMRTLLIATYRDVEVTRSHPLGNTLGALSGDTAERLHLRRLNETETAALLAQETGTASSPELVAMIHERTEGNPFFVREVARLVQADLARQDATAPDLTRIPAGVRDAIGRRLNQLTPECNELLRFGAVLGPEFDSELLRTVGSLPESSLDQLDAPVSQGIIQEVPDSLGSYQFTHHLVREVLLDELSMARRLRLHRSAAEAIRASARSIIRGNMTTLGQHVLQAAPIMEPADAARLLLRAGDEAISRYAWQSAIGYYEPAFELLDPNEPATAALRVEIGTNYGLALFELGREQDAVRTLRDVAELGLALGEPELAIRAVIAYRGSACCESGGFIAEDALIPVIDRALQLSDQVAPIFRARLLVGQAQNLQYATGTADHAERSIEFADEALQIAREADDIPALIEILRIAARVRWHPDRFDERDTIIRELLALSKREDDPKGISSALQLQIQAHAERGEIEGTPALAEQRLDELSRMHADARTGAGRSWDIWHATLTGNFDQALEKLDQAAAEQDLSQSANARDRHASHALATRRCIGTLDEIAESAHQAFHGLTERDGTSADGLDALLAAELGDTVEAARLVRVIATNDFQHVEFDQDRPAALAATAEACAIVGDTTVAQSIYETLAVFNGLNPCPLLGASGSTHRPLALLAALLDDDTRAGEHFEAALDFNTRMGARPWLAWTQLQYAEWLRTRSADTDQTRAVSLVESALETATALGMLPVETRCRRLLGQQAEAPRVARPDGLTQRELDVLTLLAQGLSNIEIGESLVISVRTVERHITNIYGKIDARGRADATAYAIRAGLQ
jgi:DNA-binding CsgD family transcriptional regulator/tetratricopeptide (TPR) repeat protein